MQKALFVALALFSFASISSADEVLRMKPGIAVMVVVPGAEKGDLKAIVGDPNIADVTFGPNNAFWFVGKKAGTTNIIVLNNASGANLYKATIEVERVPPPPPPDRTKIITLYAFPKNSEDPLISREFYCNPGCTYLPAGSQGNESSLSTTASVTRILDKDGVETGRRLDSIRTYTPPPAAQP